MAINIKRLNHLRYSLMYKNIHIITEYRYSLNDYMVVPGVMKSLGLRRQPMKLVLLNLVPPVP